MISVLMMALVMPWWGLQGSAQDVQTSSTLCLIPLNMVSTTTTSQVIAGDHAFVPEIFTIVMTLFLLLTAIICLLVILTLVLNLRKKRKWRSILLVSMLIFLVSSLVLFIGAMSAFTEVGVGSFMGEGALDVSIPGEDVTLSVLCQWGPGIGFWLYGLCIFILFSTVVCVKFNNKKGNL
jgi:phosphoglycerol transferase MdoB-like AlkP superfamily enzyme